MVVFVLLGSLFLFVPLDPGEQVLEVGGGEFPFERPGGGVVALLEGGEPVLDLVEVGEVVGGETLRCTMEKKISTWLSHDAWTGVWTMTALGKRPGEAVDGGFAAVGGAVVDDPEHPAG